MGAKFSRFADSINRRSRRSSSSGGSASASGGNVDWNGSLETGHDPAIHGAKLEDRNYNNESFKKRTVDSSDPQQNQAALSIQTQFRQHAAKQEVANMKEEVAATRIQAGVRGYLDREHVRDLKVRRQEELEMATVDNENRRRSRINSMRTSRFEEEDKIPDSVTVIKEQDKSESGEQAETEEVDIDLEDPDVEKAAIKIQAGFKGFKARKEIQDQTQDTAKPEEASQEEIDIDLDDPDVGKAAVKIQAGFRGLQARKEVVKKQENPQTTEKKEVEKQKEPEEEVDIDLTDPDVGKAALMIQAGFRGRMFKKKAAAVAPPEDDEKRKEKEESEKKEKEERGKREEEERKKMEEEEMKKKEEEERKKKEEEERKKKEEEEEVDIDLTDPEVGKAAKMIQAGFRGRKFRKKPAEEKPTSSPEPSQLNNVGHHDPGTSASPNQSCSGITNAYGSPSQVDDVTNIDLDDPDLSKAASKIQAGFRGCQTRKEIHSAKEEASKQPEVTEKVEEEEEVDIDLTDPDVEKAAIKIQAGFKGFKTRQSMKDEGEVASSSQPEAEQTETGDTTQAAAAEEEAIDIDLDDPDTKKAAIKIQAGFRGYQTRKDLQDKTDDSPAAADESQAPASEAQPADHPAESSQETEGEKKAEEEEIDIDLNDPEVEKAATKIQAGFKGFKARKEVQAKKDDGDAAQTAEVDQVDAVPETMPPEEETAQPASGSAEGGVDQTDQAEDAKAETDKEQTETAAPQDESVEKAAEETAAAPEGKDEADVDAAAVKIQAGFKGMQARRRVKALRDERSNKQGEEEVTETGGDEVAHQEEEGGEGQEVQKEVGEEEGGSGQAEETEGGNVEEAGGEENEGEKKEEENEGEKGGEENEGEKEREENGGEKGGEENEGDKEEQQGEKQAVDEQVQQGLEEGQDNEGQKEIEEEKGEEKVVDADEGS